jgi:hypothetical protein
MIFGRLWEEAENGGHSDIHRTNGASRRQVRDTRSTGSAPVRISEGEPITES